MRRWPKLLGAVGAAGLFAATAACSGGSASGAVTLTVYSVDAVHQKIWDSLLASWKRDNNVELKFVNSTPDKYVPQVQNAVRAGAPLDVIIANGQDVQTFAQQGWLAPLDGIVNTADLLPYSIDPFEADGKLYAAGIGSATFTSTVCNQTLMQKYQLAPPATFDAVQADVAKLKATDAALFAEPGASLYLWPIWFMQTIQQESSGKATDVTTATLRDQMKFTDPMYVKALQDLANFGSSGALIHGFNGLSKDNATTAVLEQKAVCNFGIDSIATVVDKATFPVSITPFPAFGSTESTPFGGPNTVTEYAKMNASHKSAADKFIKYVTTPSFNKAYLTEWGNPFPIPTATGVNMPYTSEAVAAAVNTYLPKTTVYLDWAWPKSVTGAVQQQVQAVVGGHTRAQDAATAIQQSLDQARANGFKYS